MSENNKKPVMTVVAAVLSVVVTIAGTSWKVSESMNTKFTTEVIKPVTTLETKVGLMLGMLQENKTHIETASKRFEAYDDWLRRYDADVKDMRHRTAELHEFILRHVAEEAKRNRKN